ncbi:hypothetical protein V5799_006323 [Amblyomma americanum]|uniref:Uncharacterized protein n=1 Tax=Amblyomma americanum TaxID=6943 RepID=A0AAQ4DWR2_AMBAM
MKTTLTRGRVISRTLRSVCATNSPLNSPCAASPASSGVSIGHSSLSRSLGAVLRTSRKRFYAADVIICGANMCILAVDSR